MNNSVLVINCGSSSLKLAVFDANLQRQSAASAERLGSDQANARLGDADLSLPNGAGHREALREIVAALQQGGLLNDPPLAVGHRVVHGGERFREAAVIDPNVMQAIEECASLAPLHNPLNQAGIEAALALFPHCPQVAVFDTAFHQSLPQHAYLYALPQRFYRQWGIRRYGFHGTSHNFMALRAAELLDKPVSATSIISAHLGNGCSITAIRKGASVDTSMGLTPLEGLVMGTRSGDVDPGLFDFVAAKGMSASELHRILNKESGLLGISGVSNDMRSLAKLAESGDENATLAVEIFCFRLAKYIAAMMASLNQLDALVFTGGIGENSAPVRAQTLAHLQLLGFRVDAEKNAAPSPSARSISDVASRFPVWVIPTDEEQVIAREALAFASGAARNQ